MAASIFDIFLNIIIILIFIKNRNTPIVKMSDKKVTSLYLVTSLALMICLLLAYFSKPSVSKCLVRPFIGGVLYNLHITIILVKSNKLLKVFHSNTRATSNKVMKVSLAQIFTVLVSILIACAIIISVLMRHRSEVMQEVDIKSHSRILYCSTGFHTNIVIVYLLCVQITCMFQAYRCRTLSGYLNGVTSVIYTSFVTSLVFTVQFPIYYFQKSVHSREQVQFAAMTTNSLVVLVLIYTKKVFVMVFRRSKNTPVYYQRKSLKVMEMKAREIISVDKLN